MASGEELERAEITSSFTGTSTSLADVTGLSVTVDVGSLPILVRFGCSSLMDTAGTFGAAIYLDEDGTDLGTICGVIAANVWFPAYGERRRNPASGTHTYKIRYKQVTAGTMNINAGLGTAGTVGPTFISVIEV